MEGPQNQSVLSGSMGSKHLSVPLPGGEQRGQEAVGTQPREGGQLSQKSRAAASTGKPLRHLHPHTVQN